jgi:hypothetical protein
MARQQQHVPNATLRQSDNSLTERLRKTQRKLLISNIFATLSLMVGLAGVSWGWVAMTEGDIGYFVNLSMVSLLILGAAMLIWMRLLFWKKPDFSLDSQTFIERTFIWLKRTPG